MNARTKGRTAAAGLSAPQHVSRGILILLTFSPREHPRAEFPPIIRSVSRETLRAGGWTPASPSCLAGAQRGAYHRARPQSRNDDDDIQPSGVLDSNITVQTLRSKHYDPDITAQALSRECPPISRASLEPLSHLTAPRRARLSGQAARDAYGPSPGPAPTFHVKHPVHVPVQA